jgi:hypothetical protein
MVWCPRPRATPLVGETEESIIHLGHHITAALRAITIASSTDSELKGKSHRRKCPVPCAFLSLRLATVQPNARERTRTFTILDDCTGIIIANVSGMTLHMHHELLLAGWCTGNLPHRACASQLLTRGLGRRQVARGTALVRSEHAEVAVR